MARLPPHPRCGDIFDRRAGSRVLLGILVSYRVAQLIASSVTLSSRGRIAIRIIDPLDIGTIVRLRFRLPGAGGDVDTDARVGWSDARIGTGLEFERNDPGRQAMVDQFVERQGFRNRRA